MSDKEEIKKLNSQRDRLRIKIKKIISKGDNPIEFVRKFQIINNRLIELGYKCSAKAPYLNIEYWESNPVISNPTPSIPQNSNSTTSINPNLFKGLEESIMEALGKCTEQYNTIISRMETPPQPNKYHISLVWEDENGEFKNIILEEVGKYLKEMGCSELGYDFNDGFLGKEHIYKYEYYGDESKYQTIIQSANYISELVCNIESFDVKEIAIFGKKILY
jgi:hypothetical protein